MLTPPDGSFDRRVWTWDITVNDTVRRGRVRMQVGHYGYSSHSCGFSETSGYLRRRSTTRS